MDNKVIEKLREIKNIKENFEENISSKFQLFYTIIEKYVIDTETALHNKDFAKLNHELTPETCFNALKTVKTSKESLEFLKQFIENDLKSWNDFEERIKFVQKEYQSINIHSVTSSIEIKMGEKNDFDYS